MNRTGRAAVYDAPNQPFAIRRYPLREVRPDEALVRVTMATICRSDIHSYQGQRPNPCPGILGHEIVGILDRLGERVTEDLRGGSLAEGDRVTWTMYFNDGGSDAPHPPGLPQKAPGIRKYGHDLVEPEPHFLGGFADYCYILPGTGLLKLSDDLPDEEAAPLNCGVATMIAIAEAAGISPGESLVVQGLGLLGLYGCAIAKARGAAQVIGLDPVAERRALAKDFGADITLDTSAAPPDALLQQVRALCPPDGADAALELCGIPEVVPAGLKMLRVGGRYVIGGLVNPGAELTIDGNDILRRCLTIKGVHNYHPRHLVEALDFVMANRARYPFGRLVESRFPLERIDEAFARAAERTLLRAAIVP